MPREKRHLWEDSRIDETRRRSDPTNACIRASAEKDAKYRSGSNTQVGRELLLERE